MWLWDPSLGHPQVRSGPVAQPIGGLTELTAARSRAALTVWEGRSGLNVRVQGRAQWVNMHNEGSSAVDLMWRNPDGKDSSMGSVKAHSKIRFSTFVGHEFYFTLPGSTDDLLTVEVFRNVEDYHYPRRSEGHAGAKDSADAERKTAAPVDKAVHVAEGRKSGSGKKVPLKLDVSKIGLKAALSEMQAENTAVREELDSLHRLVSDLQHTIEEEAPAGKGRLPLIKPSGSLMDMMYVMFGFVMLSGGFAIAIAFRWLRRPRR